MKKKKEFLKGLVVGMALVLVLTNTAFGKAITKQIEVIYNSVRLEVNGEHVEADNILYDGTTYVPIRAVSEMLGKEVTWDYDTYTVGLNDIEPEVSEEPKKEEKPVNLKDTEKEKKPVKPKGSETIKEKPKNENRYPDYGNTTVPSEKIEITNYLNDNYGELETSLGRTSFDISVYENNSMYSAYDYWIKVDYDSGFFLEISSGIKYTREEKEAVKQELKDHMEKMGRDIIAQYPDKKFMGGYYKSWYRYPSIKVDLITRHYYTWTNYNEPDYLSSLSSYEQTTPGHFRWDPILDDEL